MKAARATPSTLRSSARARSSFTSSSSLQRSSQRGVTLPSHGNKDLCRSFSSHTSTQPELKFARSTKAKLTRSSNSSSLFRSSMSLRQKSLSPSSSSVWSALSAQKASKEIFRSFLASREISDKNTAAEQNNQNNRKPNQQKSDDNTNPQKKDTAKNKNMSKKEVLVAVADGSEEIEAVSVIDTLRRAEINVTVASVSDKQQVKMSRGVNLVADKLMSEVKSNSFDCIVLPGGMPGATHLKDSQDLKELLEKQKREGKLIAAICASPAVVLKNHGLLEGVNKMTAYPDYQKELPNKDHAQERTLYDNNVITSQGPGTAIEFALKIVDVLVGGEKAQSVQKALLAKY